MSVGKLLHITRCGQSSAARLLPPASAAQQQQQHSPRSSLTTPAAVCPWPRVQGVAEAVGILWI